MVRMWWLGLLLLLGSTLAVPAASEEEEDLPALPKWARVAAEQIKAANEHGVPVAFENELAMRFVLIPAGTFVMGSPEAEEGRPDGEGRSRTWSETQHKVTISTSFYVQTTEVTNWQYRKWPNGTDHHSGIEMDFDLNGPDHPVANVSWFDAAAYAAWLSKQDQRRAYRLPTEAEWEYAARASTTGPWWWGSSEDVGARSENLVDESAWLAYERWFHRNRPGGQFGGKPFEGPWNDGHATSSPVATYRPNPWGLYDVLGNVREWVVDCPGPYSSEPVVDPLAASDSKGRVLRGSSWYIPSAASPRNVRVAERLVTEAGTTLKELGFRLVSPLPEKDE